jgi:hypothetical protein
MTSLFLRSVLKVSLAVRLSAIGLVPAANADCLSRCLGGCEFARSDDRYCRDVQIRCGAFCPRKGSHDFGAIAYSPSTGATGWSNKRDTQEEAEDAALENCQSHASDCAVEVWFDGKCGAIAAGQDNVSWGLGDTERQAQAEALGECRRGGASNCEVKKSVCSRGRAD